MSPAFVLGFFVRGILELRWVRVSKRPLADIWAASNKIISGGRGAAQTYIVHSSCRKNMWSPVRWMKIVSLPNRPVLSRQTAES